MNTTSSAVLTGVIVGVGRWAKNQDINMKVVISITFMAIILAVLGEVNEKFSQQMGVLVLVAAVFTYGPDIVKKAGLTK